MAELSQAGNRSLPLIWAGISIYCLACWYLIVLGFTLIKDSLICVLSSL